MLVAFPAHEEIEQHRRRDQRREVGADDHSDAGSDAGDANAPPHERREGEEPQGGLRQGGVAVVGDVGVERAVHTSRPCRVVTRARGSSTWFADRWAITSARPTNARALIQAGSVARIAARIAAPLAGWSAGWGDTARSVRREEGSAIP